MSVERFVRKLRSDLSTQQAEYIHTLINGGCSDFSDYKLKVGVLRGLKMSEESIVTTLKSMREDEDGSALPPMNIDE